MFCILDFIVFFGMFFYRVTHNFKKDETLKTDCTEFFFSLSSIILKSFKMTASFLRQKTLDIMMKNFLTTYAKISSEFKSLRSSLTSPLLWIRLHTNYSLIKIEYNFIYQEAEFKEFESRL